MDRNSCLAASQAQSQPGWPCGDAWMPEGTFRGVLGMVFQYSRSAQAFVPSRQAGPGCSGYSPARVGELAGSANLCS